MSRSYKHTPYCGDTKGKDKKRVANKKVRRFLKENPDFTSTSKKFFKKIYETYDICDYYFTTGWEKFKKIESELFPKEDLKKIYRYWITHYKRK